jgi:hypothetical protein
MSINCNQQKRSLDSQRDSRIEGGIKEYEFEQKINLEQRGKLCKARIILGLSITGLAIASTSIDIYSQTHWAKICTAFLLIPLVLRYYMKAKRNLAAAFFYSPNISEDSPAKQPDSLGNTQIFDTRESMVKKFLLVGKYLIMKGCR